MAKWSCGFALLVYCEERLDPVECPQRDSVAGPQLFHELSVIDGPETEGGLGNAFFLAIRLDAEQEVADLGHLRTIMGKIPFRQWAIDHETIVIPVGIFPSMEEGWRDRVARLLDEQNLTMKEASRRVGRGETFVRDILKRGRDPSAANLDALSRVLGVSVADILDGTSEPGQQQVAATAVDHDDEDVRAELAEVFADLVKADKRVQRRALSVLRSAVYGSGATKTN
ncbi:XRE family transcriptional regulator [Mesorhizobium tamadayense]|uniref:XRE family transcriptional regulator n=1 Tax=Mesorhizobium tamadayense TaxID=425306 RepID=A0A3P3FHF0_9HYPH|nr:helix-turn-helix transcriptional regulator [Mesorhizobium tamadayense]RRH98039.1 XRE family transcriptional regulator [Mesorhizobium tamadayense]